MTRLQEFLETPFCQKLSMTLGHFLWQGLLIGILFILLQPIWRKKTSSIRYVFNLTFFIILAATPAITFCLVEASAKPEGLSSVSTNQEDSYPSFDAIAPKQNEDSFSVPIVSETSLLSDWLEIARPYFFEGWLIGVTCLFLRLFLSVISLRILSLSREPLPAWSMQHLARISQKIGIADFSRAFSSSRIDDACAMGWIRPMILIPTAWLTSMPPHILEAVMAHELAHIKRWDNWVNGFQRLVEAILFFHPVVWWISHRVRSERELCCDECAAAILEQKVEYAEALEYIARVTSVSKTPLLANAIGGKKMLLLQRVRHVLGLQPETKSGGIWTPLVAGIAIVAMLFVGTTMNRSASADDDVKASNTKNKVLQEVKDAAPVADVPEVAPLEPIQKKRKGTRSNSREGATSSSRAARRSRGAFGAGDGEVRGRFGGAGGKGESRDGFASGSGGAARGRFGGVGGKGEVRGRFGRPGGSGVAGAPRQKSGLPGQVRRKRVPAPENPREGSGLRRGPRRSGVPAVRSGVPAIRSGVPSVGDIPPTRRARGRRSADPRNPLATKNPPQRRAGSRSRARRGPDGNPPAKPPEGSKSRSERRSGFGSRAPRPEKGPESPGVSRRSRFGAGRAGGPEAPRSRFAGSRGQSQNTELLEAVHSLLKEVKQLRKDINELKGQKKDGTLPEDATVKGQQRDGTLPEDSTVTR